LNGNRCGKERKKKKTGMMEVERVEARAEEDCPDLTARKTPSIVCLNLGRRRIKYQLCMRFSPTIQLTP
jgi:hypothetical protein